MYSKVELTFELRDWPLPVILKETDSSLRADIPTKINELIWDPRNRMSDRFHLMPIITPAFPEQNSTFNVTKSTREIIISEMKEGC